MNKPLFSVTLPVKLSNNNDGQRKSWYKSASERKRFEKMLRKMGLVRTPFEQPVVVIVTRILSKGQRLWDSSSGLRGSYKQLEDSCVACGWYHDDDPRYIEETRFKQDSSRRKDGPAVLVEVFTAV